MNTKEKIVQNALKLFLEKGFYNVSMAMIAQETGISKPAIYHHYQNKDKMVEGVLNHFTEKMSEWNREYFSGVSSGKDFVRRMFSAIPIYKNVECILLDGVEGNFQYSYNDLLMTLSKYKSSFRNRIARDILKATDKLRSNIEEIQVRENISRDIDPSNLAFLVHCLIEGSAFISEIDENLDLEKRSEELFKTFWLLLNNKELS